MVYQIMKGIDTLISHHLSFLSGGIKLVCIWNEMIEVVVEAGLYLKAISTGTWIGQDKIEIG